MDNNNEPSVVSKAATTGAKIAGNSVEAAGTAVRATGAAVQAGGKVTEATGATMQAGGKAAQAAGVGMQAGGKALDAGGKGLSAAGNAMTQAGAGLSSTGLGAIAGVPLAALGAATNVAGVGAQAGGKGLDVAGNATRQGGKAVDNAGRQVRRTGKNISQQGKNISQQGKNLQQKGKDMKEISSIGEDENGENLIKSSTSKIKSIITLISTFGTGFFIILIIVIIATLFSYMMIAWDIAGGAVSDFFSSMGHWLTGDGWCASETECAQDAEKKYNEKIDEIVKYWKNECGDDFEVDTNVLIAASTYSNPGDISGSLSGEVDDEETSEDAAEEEKDKYQLGTSVLDDLSRHLVHKSNGTCENNYQIYYNYLNSSFIKSNYKDLLPDDNDSAKYEIEDIADEIIAYSVYNVKVNQSGSGIYDECSGVTVVDKDGNIEGTYDLETYVAGVLDHEINETWGTEALKAHAIAVRTYTLSRTENCTKTITNSESDQTFRETDSLVLKAAVSSTLGLVMKTSNTDKIFSAEYAAWYGPECSANGLSLSCTDNECTSEFFTKGGTSSKRSFTMDKKYFTYSKPGTNLLDGYDNDSLGGHCRGMFQFGSKYLDLGLGYNYEKILDTFYEDFVITSLTPAESTGIFGGNYDGFNVRDERSAPTYATASQYFNYSLSGGLLYQCPWYSKGRAIEILSTVTGIDESLRQKAIDAVKNTSGNGGDWFGRSQNGGTLSIFGSSTDYTKPKPGSIVSWYYTDVCYAAKVKNDGWNANYGHVGIVERVDEATGKVLISEGWSKCWGNATIGNENSCRGYQATWWTLDQILRGKSGCYDFQGYVYLLN